MGSISVGGSRLSALGSRVWVGGVGPSYGLTDVRDTTYLKRTGDMLRLVCVV